MYFISFIFELYGVNILLNLIKKNLKKKKNIVKSMKKSVKIGQSNEKLISIFETVIDHLNPLF